MKDASFFPVPAVGTELAFRKTDGIHQVIQTMITQTGEVLLFAYVFDHDAVFLRLGIGIAFDVVGFFGPFQLFHHTASDQIHERRRTGEV